MLDKAWANFVGQNMEQEPPKGAICSEDFVRMSKGSYTLDAAKCMLMRRAKSGDLTEVVVRRRRGAKLMSVRYYLPKLK